MAIENGDRRRTSADRRRQPGDQRCSHTNRRITERASRARQLNDREAQVWQLKAAGYTHIGSHITAQMSCAAI
jgi:hypothetical protein